MRYAVRSLDRANTWLVEIERSNPMFTHDAARRLETTDRLQADALAANLRAWAFACEVVTIE